MRHPIVVALRVALVTLITTGLVYPSAVTGLAQLLFPEKANGSLVRDEQGRVVGSELIGQRLSRAEYFQGRPSAAGEKGYDGASSSGSNLGPTEKKLRDRIVADFERLTRENPDAPRPIPAELVTASGSGLDPHLSPAGALWQVPRVAKARGVAPERIRDLVRSRVEGAALGFLGKPRVNVLLLNLALDRLLGATPPPPAPEEK